MPRRTGKITWTALLLKKGFTEANAVKESLARRVRGYEVVANQRIGQLVVGPKRPNQPRWLRHVKPYAPSLPELLNETVSAVLLVPAANRTFALTLGYGRFLLESDSWEDGFGLKVTLNAVPPGSIKSIDRTSFDAFAHQTRTQGIRSGDLEQFGLDVEQDILRAVTGKPEDESLGDRLAGKDALVFNARVDVPGLPGFLARYLAKYRSNAYQEWYPDLDQLAEVSDGTLLDRLNGELLRKIREDDRDRLWLAVPEFVDWARSGFRYGPASYEPYPDLDFKDLFTHLHHRETMRLEGRRVYCVDLETGVEVESWPLVRCLHTEIVLGDKTCVLSNGRWYQVAQDFVARVDRKVNPLLQECSLPGYGDKDEARYNRRIAKSEGHFLFDRKNVHHGGRRSQIEPCDLLTKDRRLIHIKRYGGSSTLSHLFAQGYVASELLAEDGKYREKMRAKLPDEIKHLIPIDRIDPARYTVVYAIVGRSSEGRKLAELLPFFSRANLYRTAQRLGRIGYKVGVQWVGPRGGN